MADFDVLVIGAGPGGYVAAIRAAQLGFKTACIESWMGGSGKPVLGGTCLNVGCIPSKALLDSSHHVEFMRHEASAHGITTSGLEIDLATMMARKDKTVSALTTGVAGLFKKHGVEWLQGHGRFEGPDKVVVTPNGTHPETTTTYTASHIIVATGSVPVSIPQAPIDGHRIVDSTGALSFDVVPERLGVIGAGVIGLELGSVWRRLGADVVLLEAQDSFLPVLDPDVATASEKIFRKQGLDIRMGCKVTATNVTASSVQVHYESADGPGELEVDKLIVAVGRKPNTSALSPELAGLKLDARGAIEVDDHLRTPIEGIYALGDVVRGPMLAHKAMEEGVAVAERIAGEQPEVELDIVPWVIYTWPEIAWCGPTEAEATAQGHTVRAGKFPFLASGRARAMGDTDGMVKIIADANTDQLLGAQIVGPNASELIAEVATALSMRASAEDIARTWHAHPTLAEALHEAALGVDARSLHI